MGDNKKALKETNEMLLKYPGQPSLYMLRSGIYTQMKNYDAAFKDSQALSSLGVDALAVNDAYIRYKMGYKDAAFNILDTLEENLADKTGTTASLVYQTKAELYIEDGNLDKAVEYLRKYIAIEKVFKEMPATVKDLKKDLKKYKGDPRAAEITAVLDKAKNEFPSLDGATIGQIAANMF